MSNPSRNRAAAAAILLVLLLMSAIALLRAQIVNATYGPVVGCESCFIWPALMHDLALVGIALAWIAMSLRIGVRWLRTLLLLPLLLMVILLIADVAVLDLLAQRLLVNDLFKFGSEFGAVERIGRASFSRSDLAIGASLIIAAIAFVVLVWRAAAIGWHTILALLCAAAAIGGVGWFGRGTAPGYVHADAYRNWIEVNLAQSIDAPYSDAFLAQQREKFVTTSVCTAGQSRNPSLMIVMVESLSTYHSSLYVAEPGYMPKFDALTRAEGSWFADFIANGFTTDGGMVATLSGRVPIPGFHRYESTDAFTGFEDPRGGFAEAVEAAGYKSLFFTTGTLGFVDKEGWLPKIGIDHFEGAEAPFYAGMPRGVFEAADDPQLFARVLDWYRRERDPAQPFAATILTVATHPPFLVRATGARNEHAVFATLDQALVDFHAQLQAERFFDNGILIVMGDHRSMTPLKPEEYQRYGESAFARTPMMVFGASGMPRGEIHGLTQQIDLPVSLRDLTAPEACREPQQGLWFRSPPIPARYALHARGMPRSQIDVYRADGSYALQLAGDASRWIGAKPEDGDRIAARIHSERAARAPNRGDLLQRLIQANAEVADQSMKTSDKPGQ